MMLITIFFARISFSGQATDTTIGRSRGHPVARWRITVFAFHPTAGAQSQLCAAIDLIRHECGRLLCHFHAAQSGKICGYWLLFEWIEINPGTTGIIIPDERNNSELAWFINIFLFFFRLQCIQIVLLYYPGHEMDAGRIGLCIVLAGMMGSVCCGIVLDKTHRFK